MRYKRVELSAQNKPQYVIALGVRDMELLLGEADNAKRFMPRTPENKEDIERLGGIVKGLNEALQKAWTVGDTGNEVSIDERHKFRSEYLDKITRFEVIDYRPCVSCDGVGRVFNKIGDVVSKSAPMSNECPLCLGAGFRGREVVFFDDNTKMTSSVQDEGRTLKVFIKNKEKNV